LTSPRGQRMRDVGSNGYSKMETPFSLWWQKKKHQLDFLDNNKQRLVLYRRGEKKFPSKSYTTVFKKKKTPFQTGPRGKRERQKSHHKKEKLWIQFTPSTATAFLTVQVKGGNGKGGIRMSAKSKGGCPNPSTWGIQTHGCIVKINCQRLQDLRFGDVRENFSCEDGGTAEGSGKVRVN